CQVILFLMRTSKLFALTPAKAVQSGANNFFMKCATCYVTKEVKPNSIQVFACSRKLTLKTFQSMLLYQFTCLKKLIFVNLILFKLCPKYFQYLSNWRNCVCGRLKIISSQNQN